MLLLGCFFFSSRRRHTRCLSDWSSDVCSSDLCATSPAPQEHEQHPGAGDVAQRSRKRDAPHADAVERQIEHRIQDEVRSEERRVGKECRSRRTRDHEKKKEERVKKERKEKAQR